MVEIPLKERLEMFTIYPCEKGEPWGLKGLLAYMTPDNINPATLGEHTVASSVDVPALVRTTLGGQFIVDPIIERTMRVFTDEATVVVFGKGLVGYYENANGAVHEKHGAEEYGYTLLPYAARKGARRWHLEATDRGDMRNVDNYRYLQSIGPKNVGVFIGDAADEDPIEYFEVADARRHFLVVVGVSGAQMTEEFLSFLTGGNIKEHTPELFAGIGDTILAEAVVQRLRHPKLEVHSIPRDVSQLALWH